MKDNRDFLSNSYSTSVLYGSSVSRLNPEPLNSDNYLKTTTESGAAKKWSTGLPKPSEPESYTRFDFSSSPAYSGSYDKLKMLPQEFSQMRQTFDTRSNNRIRDLISKYDDPKTAVNSTAYDYKERMYRSPNGAEKYTYEVAGYDEKAKNEERSRKYSHNIPEVPAKQTESSTSRVADEIQRLKEERRKRLEARQKQAGLYNSNYSSSSASNLTSSYKSASQRPAKLKIESNRDTGYAQLLNPDLDGFKKKKTGYQMQAPYTPKYQKKKYEDMSPVISAYDKEKRPTEPVSDSKLPIYTKYEYKSTASTSSSPLVIPPYQGATATSPSSQKKVAPVEYVEINGFVLGKSLGEGKFGVVYQAFHKATGWLYAIKKIPKEMIKSHLMIDQFILELKLQTFLYHENILSLYHHFDDKTHLYLVLEYMEGGTLYSLLKKNKKLSENEVASKIREVASAVKYLHENQIAHRDIKPQNVVISHGVGKLCDFGWATICSDRRKTYCGTFDYAPPEILSGAEYDFTVDLWCLGVLTYQLLVGKAPFYHISRKQTMKKIMNVQNTTIQYPQSLSKNAINFIDSLIKKDPKDRLSTEHILEHPFLRTTDKANKL